MGMTWTRIGDDFCDREDLLACSRSARLLYVELLVYGNRLELDGRIPSARLTRFSDDPEALTELVDRGLVRVDGGDMVVDWTDQEPAERIQQRRKYNAEKQARYRDRKAACAAGDHRLCDGRFCKSKGALPSNETGHETGVVTDSRPVPPVPSQGQGQGQPDDHADASTGCPDCGMGLRSGKHAFDCERVQREAVG